jgi:hypothetical protein
LDTEQPAERPLVEWTTPQPPPPPSSDVPRGELFGDRSPADLTLGDAISTGFRVLTMPSFIVPLLILGLVVNVVVTIVFGPLISEFSAGGRLTPAELAPQLGGVVGGIGVALIGSILISLYGSIWAVAASSGPIPGSGAVTELMGRRWAGIIGTGIAVGVMLIGAFIGIGIVGGTVGVLVHGLSIIVFIVMFALLAWIALRLSLAVWLAADGASVSDSIRGSWAMTKGNLMRIFGWTLAYGIVFAIVTAVLGFVLNLIPYVGPAILQSLSLALGYGAGVTLYRRTQAAAAGVDPTFG